METRYSDRMADKRTIAQKYGNKELMDKKLKPNPKYKNIGKVIDTGSTINNVAFISEQTKKKEIELFKKSQKEELAKSNEENKKKLYLIQKNKDKSKDKIINKYRARKVEMMLRQKDEEFIAKKMLQKVFRSGKRSMSQETRTTYNASNYFK